MTHRVRLIDAGTGEVLAEGIRPCSVRTDIDECSTTHVKFTTTIRETWLDRAARIKHEMDVERLGPPPSSFPVVDYPCTMRYVPGPDQWRLEVTSDSDVALYATRTMEAPQ